MEGGKKTPTSSHLCRRLLAAGDLSLQWNFFFDQIPCVYKIIT